MPSIAVLVDTLRRHGLLEADQLGEVTARVGQFADAKALLKDLLKRGWLTRFQAQTLLAGKGAELALGSCVLLEPVGEGGMGQVYRAMHRNLRRIVAVKRIRPEFLNNERAIKRFYREVRAVAQLSHPNIVKAYDADQVGNEHFLVMEFVEGIDLAQMVQEQGPPPVASACEYLRQAALGLQHAFERGLIHRDIKPTNLLLTPQGQIKVLDLGLARFENSTESLHPSLTREGVVLGTVDFIAPEQATDSRSADIRADLYSLGCTLYFLLTAQVPFPGNEVVAKVLKHRLEHPTPIELIRPEVPEPVLAIARTLMEKKPEDRYATPAELVAALERAADGSLPTEAPATVPPVLALALSSSQEGLPFDDLEMPDSAPPRRRSARTLRTIAAIVVLCLALGATGYFLARQWPAILGSDPATKSLERKP
jgi:serine/threonine-protein kinase